MTYSSSLAMRRQKYTASKQNTTTIVKQSRTLGPVSNTIALVILSCLLGLIYLTQVTKTNALSYELNDLRSHQNSLENENNELQVNAARLQSLERAKSSSVAAKLTPIAPSASASN